MGLIFENAASYLNTVFQKIVVQSNKMTNQNSMTIKLKQTLKPNENILNVE